VPAEEPVVAASAATREAAARRPAARWFAASVTAVAAWSFGWNVVWPLGVVVVRLLAVVFFTALKFLRARDVLVVRVEPAGDGGELGQDAIQLHQIGLKNVARAGHGWRCLGDGL
jgi:hypothetical protein